MRSDNIVVIIINAVVIIHMHNYVHSKAVLICYQHKSSL